MQHILTAIDGSEPSYRALEHAAKLAKSIDAELSVLIVCQFVVSRQGVYFMLDDDDAQRIQDKAKEILSSMGKPEVYFIREKSRDAAFTIVDTAISKGADLIVMGASGIEGLKKFFLGSVSQEVLRKSACPVTIVH